MNVIEPLALPWLEANAHPQHWAEVFFVGRCYGYLTSNISESLNVWILEARDKPILPMFEQIRKQLTKWYSERHLNETTTIGLLMKNIAKAIMVLHSYFKS